MEFEDGTTTWWTPEVYLDAKGMFHNSTVSTGAGGKTGFGIKSLGVTETAKKEEARPQARP